MILKSILGTLIVFNLIATPGYPAVATNQFFLTSKDGSKIEYFLSKPKNKERKPLIIFIHGHQFQKRPGGADFAKWGVLKKWSDLGFVGVAMSQPGYGNSSGSPDFCGPITQQALHALIEKLKVESFVDSKRIALVGISRGAVVAEMVAAKRTDISGIVLNGGSYNIEELYKSLPDSDTLKQNIKEENGATQDAFNIRSFLNNLSNFKTPTLILHGKKDSATSVKQASELYEQLQKQGVVANIQWFDSGHQIPIDKRNKVIQPFLEKLLN